MKYESHLQEFDLKLGLLNNMPHVPRHEVLVCASSLVVSPEKNVFTKGRAYNKEKTTNQL